MMKLLTFITEAFIAAFGITRPDPRDQRKVSLLLGGLLLAAAVGVVAVVTSFLIWQAHYSR